MVNYNQYPFRILNTIFSNAISRAAYSLCLISSPSS